MDDEKKKLIDRANSPCIMAKIIIIKSITIIFLLLFSFLFTFVKIHKKININNFNSNNEKNNFFLGKKTKTYNHRKIISYTPKNNIKKYDKENVTFAIITKKRAICGLFSFYIYFLGCINICLTQGYIPVVDLMSYPNAYNNFSFNSKNNFWEVLFEQPFGYTLEEVLKKPNKKYFDCEEDKMRPNELTIYYNKVSIEFWHDFAYKYMPIKNEIIVESNKIIKKLFQGSNNTLGVKIRGTDYVARREIGHPKPPNTTDVIRDVRNMLEKYKYDWIFFSSEDETIKEIFIKEFEPKIKYLNPNIKLNYDSNESEYIIFNAEVRGNLEYAKNYVMNMYILSKCTDIVMSRGSGSTGIFIFTNGFRNSLVYNLGVYR